MLVNSQRCKVGCKNIFLINYILKLGLSMIFVNDETELIYLKVLEINRYIKHFESF